MQPKTEATVSEGAEVSDTPNGAQTDIGVQLNNLIAALTAPEFQEETALQLMQRISQDVGKIDIEQNVRMTKIMNIHWMKRSENFLTAYCRFVIGIATVQMYYLRPVMRCFIIRLRPFVDKKANTNDTDAIEQPMADEAAIAHEHLRLLMKYVPMVSNQLPQVLQECFPYIKRPAEVISAYVKNLLMITEYRTDMRLAILAIIIDELTKLDVHASREDIEEAEEIAAAGPSSADTSATMFDMETEESKADVVQPTVTASDTSNQTLHEMGHRVDLCMDQLFYFVQKTCCSKDSSSVINAAATRTLYQELLDIFQQFVMPIHACCHVQFIMFYMCSLHQAICKHFLDRLWHHVQDPNLSHIIRTSAAFYISSMMSRAKFVTIQECHDRLKQMVAWIHQYIDTYDSISAINEESSLIHSTFYAVCQGVFYLIAFRFRELLHMENGIKLLQGFALERIVKCQLNPLQHCAANVTTNFANITRNYQLAYCYTIIERNRRQELYGGSHHHHHHHNNRQLSYNLESFFPFDPYILKRSGEYITPLYRHYCGLDSEEVELEGGDEIMPLSESCSPKSLERSESFREHMMYGVSPGFKHKTK